MNILSLGLDYDTGDTLVPPINARDFYDWYTKGLQERANELEELARPFLEKSAMRGEKEHRPTADLSDPRAAGWTFLVNQADPHCAEIIEILEPLALRRGMVDPSAPLFFHGETVEEWFDWMMRSYYPPEPRKPPLYVLIAGGPEQVPFAFQSILSSAAAVGRVSFETLDELHAYVAKVLRLERAPDPAPTNQAIFFAPDGGPRDATSLSRRYLAQPLIDSVQENSDCQAAQLLGEQATRHGLVELLRGARPALVFTASHGLAAPKRDLDFQRRMNGAICCQDPGGFPLSERIFSASDVPAGEPFLEGAVFFQFGCFGYGTPAESDYKRWLGQPVLNSAADFIAALPRRLLAHPRGPVAFISHLDIAWLHGFADPADPHPADQWHPRIAPFKTAVHELLNCRPPGLAMRDMNKRYDVLNANLSYTQSQIGRSRLAVDDNLKRKLANLFITRADAQNYMVFGDPAAQVRIGVEEGS